MPLLLVLNKRRFRAARKTKDGRRLKHAIRYQRAIDARHRASRMSGSRQATKLLDAVEAVLAKSSRPLTARDISRQIKADDNLSPLLGGVTPHKTIQARIAIEILQHSDKSRFYRHAPGTFGLRSSMETGKYSEEFRFIFRGIRRRQQISKENVLCVDLANLPHTMSGGFYHHSVYPLRLVQRLGKYWVGAAEAENLGLSPLVAFILLRSSEGILSFEPSQYEEKHKSISNTITIGLQGSIREDDADLFDETRIGFYNAVEREVSDFLNYFGCEAGAIKDIEYLGIVRDDSKPDRRDALGVVACATIPNVDISHRRLGYRSLRWRKPKGLPNDFSYFDGWSQYVYAGLAE